MIFLWTKKFYLFSSLFTYCGLISSIGVSLTFISSTSGIIIYASDFRGKDLFLLTKSIFSLTGFLVFYISF